MKMHFSAVVLSVVFATACGKDSTPAPAPTPVTPTVTSLTISGNDALRTTLFGNYEATATLSNGTTQTVTTSAQWASSSPGIASVDGATAGRLNATSQGVITLTATYQGSTASKSVSVVNNYGGTWSGTYQLTACDQAGAFNAVRWCQGLGGVGALLPYGLSLDQSISNDRTQVRGTLSLGQLVGNVTGNVTSDGRLVLGGAYQVSSGGVTFTIQIGGWDTRLSGASMTGRWASNLSAVGTAGNAYMEQILVSSTHLTPQSSPTPAPATLNFTMGGAAAAMR